jgi:hypothetical protein
MEYIAVSAKPDTILGWYRKLIANKYAHVKSRRTMSSARLASPQERRDFFDSTA